MSGADVAPRLIPLFAAKQFLGGANPESIGVARVPGPRRQLYDRTAIEAALDALRAPRPCPHCGGDLSRQAVPQKEGLDVSTGATHLDGVSRSTLSREEQGRLWLNGAS